MASLVQRDDWLASDEPIGPGNGRIFDFTLVFENSLLSILPAACLLLLIAPLHVWKYSRGPKVASAGSLYWARLVRTGLTHGMEVLLTCYQDNRRVSGCRGGRKGRDIA